MFSVLELQFPQCFRGVNRKYSVTLPFSELAVGYNLSPVFFCLNLFKVGSSKYVVSAISSS